MKIRSSEVAIDRIRADLGARRKELLDLDLAFRSGGHKARRYALRSRVALIYAHLEGFTKNTCETVLNYCSNGRPKIPAPRLPVHLAIVAMRKALDSVAPLGFNSLAALHKEFLESPDSCPHIPPKGSIRTYANVSSLVLAEAMIHLGADLQLALIEQERIDDLLKYRNCIAHGEWTTPSLKEVEILQDLVIDLMERISFKAERSVLEVFKLREVLRLNRT